MARPLLPAALAVALAAGAGRGAVAQPPALTRTILQQAQLAGDRHATTVARVTVAAGAGVPRHVHPGVEIGYVLDGAGVLLVDGKPPQPLHAGDSFQAPEGVPHALTNADQRIDLLVVFSTVAGQPLSSPAPGSPSP